MLIADSLFLLTSTDTQPIISGQVLPIDFERVQFSEEITLSDELCG